MKGRVEMNVAAYQALSLPPIQIWLFFLLVDAMDRGNYSRISVKEMSQRIRRPVDQIEDALIGLVNANAVALFVEPSVVVNPEIVWNGAKRGYEQTVIDYKEMREYNKSMYDNIEDYQDTITAPPA